MIADCLTFLRAHLNAQLAADPDDATADKVVFLDGDKLEPIAFKLGAVTQLLINVEEERVLRGADPYTLRGSDPGQRVQPELRLILYILFVARFKRYEQAWEQLSQVLKQFQARRVFQQGDKTSPPPAGIDKLMLELVTLSIAEQNELWSMLRTSQHPSLLYRVHMLVLRDQEPVAQAPLRTPIIRVTSSLTTAVVSEPESNN